MNYFQEYTNQMMSFQIAAFERSFAVMDMVQEQAERMFISAYRQTPWLPEESKHFVVDWIEAMQEGRRCFRQTVQKSFNLIQDRAEQAIQAETKAAPKFNGLSKQELEEIPGIGEATLEKILKHRAKSGPFKSWEDLQNSVGLSAPVLERLQKEYAI